MNDMPPVKVLCYYKVDPKDEAAFVRLLEKHWPTLHGAGLATDEPARVLRAEDRDGKIVLIEYFAWKDEAAPGLAHQMPEVMQVWEPMGALTHGVMEFWDTTPVPMSFGK